VAQLGQQLGDAVDDLRPLPTDQSPQDLCPGPVRGRAARFPCATPQHRDAGVVGNGVDGGLDQRGLADARRAGDQDQRAAPSCAEIRERVGQRSPLGAAADQRRSHATLLGRDVRGS
jgi:hypothetical protein